MVRKPQAITYTLAAFFLATVPVDFLVPPERIVPVLAFADAVMVAVGVSTHAVDTSSRFKLLLSSSINASAGNTQGFANL